MIGASHDKRKMIKSHFTYLCNLPHILMKQEEPLENVRRNRMCKMAIRLNMMPFSISKRVKRDRRMKETVSCHSHYETS